MPPSPLDDSAPQPDGGALTDEANACLFSDSAPVKAECIHMPGCSCVRAAQRDPQPSEAARCPECGGFPVSTVHRGPWNGPVVAEVCAQGHRWLPATQPSVPAPPTAAKAGPGDRESFNKSRRRPGHPLAQDREAGS